MLQIREATFADAPAIRDIFRACYGDVYPYHDYYDLRGLSRMIASDDMLILVAEETDSGKVVGTASVLLEVGAFADLVGEFGRLAVAPEAQNRGIGSQLMTARLQRVQDRLHVGLVETRTSHPFALKITEGQQFAVVGFMPLKMRLAQRESLVLLVRYFGNALQLRKNHPRIIPEVHPLAHLALEHCALAPDVIVDEESPPYACGGDFAIEELTAEGYAPLLRIERGRVRRREIFGPLRLHYGSFKLQVHNSRYLLSRDHGQVAGAVGFILDPVERVVRVFELIAIHDHVIRPLLSSLECQCREEWGMEYIEVDVSAHAPRMQRTLLELQFVPAAYVPALVFHEVERLDVVKMVRLLVAQEPSLPPAESQRARAMAEPVLRQLAGRAILPRIAQAVQELPLFSGLQPEQVHRLAGVCSVTTFVPGEVIFRAGSPGQEMYILLQGEAGISMAGSPSTIGVVQAGECLSEISLLTRQPHSATATARTDIEAVRLGYQDLTGLTRLRPDIALLIYRNLALGLAQKLRRTNADRNPECGGRMAEAGEEGGWL